MAVEVEVQPLTIRAAGMQKRQMLLTLLTENSSRCC